MGKVGFLIDETRCTGCRACQIACKQWNELEAVHTENTGSYENPPEIHFDLYTRIAFREHEEGDSIHWAFTKEQCLHCGDPACVKACPSPGALVKTPEGIVIRNEDKCIGCKYCMMVCPFLVPKWSEERQKISKCHLCYERVVNGLVPACAKTCTKMTSSSPRELSAPSAGRTSTRKP